MKQLHTVSIYFLREHGKTDRALRPAHGTLLNLRAHLTSQELDTIEHHTREYVSECRERRHGEQETEQ